MSDVLAEAIVKITVDKTQLDAGMKGIHSQINNLRTESKALKTIGAELGNISKAMNKFIVLPGLALAIVGIKKYFHSSLQGSSEMRSAWKDMMSSVNSFLQRVGAVVNQGGRLTNIFKAIADILDRITPRMIDGFLNVVKWTAVLSIVVRMTSSVMLMAGKFKDLEATMMKLAGIQGGGGMLSALLGTGVGAGVGTGVGIGVSKLPLFFATTKTKDNDLKDISKVTSDLKSGKGFPTLYMQSSYQNLLSRINKEGPEKGVAGWKAAGGASGAIAGPTLFARFGSLLSNIGSHLLRLGTMLATLASVAAVAYLAFSVLVSVIGVGKNRAEKTKDALSKLFDVFLTIINIIDMVSIAVGYALKLLAETVTLAVRIMFDSITGNFHGILASYATFTKNFHELNKDFGTSWEEAWSNYINSPMKRSSNLSGESGQAIGLAQWANYVQAHANGKDSEIKATKENTQATKELTAAISKKTQKESNNDMIYGPTYNKIEAFNKEFGADIKSVFDTKTNK